MLAIRHLCPGLDIEVGADSTSFFGDLRNSKMGDWATADQLNRNPQARGMQSRAGDMSTTNTEAAPSGWCSGGRCCAWWTRQRDWRPTAHGAMVEQ
jgi:hypothetical protein